MSRYRRRFLSPRIEALFNKTYKWKPKRVPKHLTSTDWNDVWHVSSLTDGKLVFNFSTDNNVPYDVEMKIHTNSYDQVLEARIEFKNLNQKPREQMIITGDGDALAVFATVLDILAWVMFEVPLLKEVIFTASKFEFDADGMMRDTTHRGRLYEKISRKFVDKHGWNLGTRNARDFTLFAITR